MKTVKHVSDNELLLHIPNSLSFRSLCNTLDIRYNASAILALKKRFDLLNIDTSHFLGSAIHRGRQFTQTPKTKPVIKKRLIEQRGHLCEDCGRSKWLGKLITLELEHIDGNNKNNFLDNLLLLCPNCHATTVTWKRKKSSLNNAPLPPKAKKIVVPKAKKNKVLLTPNYCKCGAEINRSSKQCLKCAHVKQYRIVWPSVGEVVALVSASSFVAVGRSLGVSDNAVRKFLRGNGVDPKTLLPFVE